MNRRVKRDGNPMAGTWCPIRGKWIKDPAPQTPSKRGPSVAFLAQKKAERDERLSRGVMFCAGCGLEKALAEFPTAVKNKHGEPRYRYCKPCHAFYQRGVVLKRNYNLTWDDYGTISMHQNGVCAICGRPPKKMRLSVDHDHKTGLIRGLLCFLCNQVIGMFRDDIERARAFIRYMENPPATTALGAERYGIKGGVKNSAKYRMRINRAPKAA